MQGLVQCMGSLGNDPLVSAHGRRSMAALCRTQGRHTQSFMPALQCMTSSIYHTIPYHTTTHSLETLLYAIPPTLHAQMLTNSIVHGKAFTLIEKSLIVKAMEIEINIINQRAWDSHSQLRKPHDERIRGLHLR